MNSDNVKKVNKTSSVYKTLAFTAFRRTIWVPIIWSVLMIVLTFTMLDGFVNYYSGYYRMTFQYNLSDIIEEVNEFMPMYVISIIFSAFFGAMQFSFLTKINSVGFIHSLPASRNGIFASYYLSGVVSVIIPQIVLAAGVLLIPVKGKALFALFVLIVGLLYSVGVYSFGVMMSMFSGKTIGGVLFTVVGLATPYLVENFIRIIMNTSLFGYYNDSEFLIQEYVYLIPEMVLSLKGLIYLAAIVIFTVCAWLLYKRNHSELAGDLVAYPGIRGVAIAICGILAGVTGYLVFDGNLFVFGLFGIICSVLVNFAVKKRFEIKSSAVSAAVLAGITLVVFIIFNFDITGFEARIPDTDDIESVQVYENYRRNNVLTYVDGSYIYMNNEPTRITDKEKIEIVRDFHKDMIGNRDYYEYRNTYTNVQTMPYDGGRYDPYSSGSFVIEYKLKNGKTLIRSYVAYHGRNRDAILNVISLPETRVYDHPIMRDDIKVNYARLETSAGVVSLTAQESEKVRQALALDIAEAPAETERGLNDFRSISPIYLDFEYVFTEAVDEKGRIITDTEVLKYHSSDTHEALYPHYTRTINMLYNLGYGEYLDFENLPDDVTITIEKHEVANGESINFEKYKQQGEEYMKLTTEVYLSQKSGDKELIKSIMQYAFSVSSENCDEIYDTAYRISLVSDSKASSISDISFHIYGKVDFIEEWLKTTNTEKVQDMSYDGVPYMENKYEKPQSVTVIEQSRW